MSFDGRNKKASSEQQRRTPYKWSAVPTKEHGLLWHFENVFRPARLATAAEQTIYQYRYNLARLDTFLKRAALLTDLTDETEQAAENWLVNEQGASPASIEKFRENIKAIWALLFRRRIVDTESNLPKYRAPKKIPSAWTPEQLRMLWDFLSRMPGEIEGVPANLWFQSLHAVLWDSAERINATMHTKWSDVDLDGGWIVIRAETRKKTFNTGDKLSRLHPETVALLRKIVSPKRERIWPWPYCETYLHQVYRQILTRAGLPSGRENSFHKMRKSVASYVRANGGNASDVLGHSDPRLTDATYIDPRIAPKPHAADFLPRIHEIGKATNHGN